MTLAQQYVMSKLILILRENENHRDEERCA